MRNKTWHIYSLVDGTFTGSRISGPVDEQGNMQPGIERSIPEGHGAIEGVIDAMSQRVNLLTRTLEDYQPPQPSTDHGWDAVTKRWSLNAAVVQRMKMERESRARIAQLELAQLRPMREIALYGAESLEAMPAVRRLNDIERQIRVLRASVVQKKQA